MRLRPRTDLERRLATICQDILGVERMGVDDYFLDLFADPTRLVARMAEDAASRWRPEESDLDWLDAEWLA